MKEIKFRAWDKNKKEMFDVMRLNCFLFNKPSKYSDGSGVPDNFEIMQFTGLKDKNGVEIYENDILIFQNEVTGIVIWDITRGGWYFDSEGDFCDYGFTLGIANNSEIIGNIYENPELLKEK